MADAAVFYLNKVHSVGFHRARLAEVGIPTTAGLVSNPSRGTHWLS